MGIQAHQQGAGKEVEQLGPEPATIGDAGVVGGKFICCATAPAPGLKSFQPQSQNGCCSSSVITYDSRHGEGAKGKAQLLTSQCSWGKDSSQRPPIATAAHPPLTDTCHVALSPHSGHTAATQQEGERQGRQTLGFSLLQCGPVPGRPAHAPAPHPSPCLLSRIMKILTHPSSHLTLNPPIVTSVRLPLPAGGWSPRRGRGQLSVPSAFSVWVPLLPAGDVDGSQVHSLLGLMDICSCAASSPGGSRTLPSP